MLDVYKKAELSFWISWFKWNKTIWSLVLVDLIILKVSVVHKITNLKQLFIALSWTVLFVGETEMCLVIVLFTFLSPLVHSAETYLEWKLTWPLEPLKRKQFRIFRSVLCIVLVWILVVTHTSHCSHVAANVLLKMGLAKWPYSCYRKFNTKLFDFMPKESRESASHTTWLVSISFPSHWHLSCFQLCFQSNYWLQYIVDLYSTNNGL